MNYGQAEAAIVSMCTDVALFRRLLDAGMNKELFVESVGGSSVPKQIFELAKAWYLRDGTVPSRSVLEQDPRFEQYFKHTNVATVDAVELQPEYVVEFFKNNAIKIGVQAILKQSADRIFKPDADQLIELSRLHSDISRLYLDVSTSADVMDMSRAANQVTAELLGRADDPQTYRDSLIKFPFGPMNDSFVGLRPRELALFFGYTGDMKSLTLEYTTYQNALAGKRVAHFTLENGIEITTARLLAFISGLPLSRLQHGGVMPRDRDALLQARDKLADMSILLDQSSSPSDRTVEAIFTKARSYNADLVVIDQASWIATPDIKYRTLWEVQAEVVRRVMQHTRELGVVTVMAAQANRESQRTRQGTELMHIAGSDEITKTATVVASLNFDKQSELLEVRVVKNRNNSSNLAFQMRVELNARTYISLDRIL